MYLLLFNVYFVDVRSNMHSIFVHIIMVRLFSLGICILFCICAFVYSLYLIDFLRWEIKRAQRPPHGENIEFNGRRSARAQIQHISFFQFI